MSFRILVIIVVRFIYYYVILFVQDLIRHFIWARFVLYMN